VVFVRRILRTGKTVGDVLKLNRNNVDLVESGGLPFTAQPEAPAFFPAGVSGRVVNDIIISLLAMFGYKWIASRSPALWRTGVCFVY
jgi:hypothetical protein